MRKARSIRAGKDQGYILVFILGVLMTIGLLLADVSRRSHLGGSVLLNSVERIEKRHLTGGGIEIGLSALAGHLSKASSGPLPIPFVARLGENNLAIEIEDECGKLNLKTADVGTMIRLFGRIGLEAEVAEKMSLSILDARGDLSVRGALGPGSLAALSAAGGGDAKALLATSRFVTIHCPRRGVSFQTAPGKVLEALPGANLSAISQFDEDRQAWEGTVGAVQLSAPNLSSQPGQLSTAVGPIYTIRSSIVNNGERGFTQERLVYVGGRNPGIPKVLRITFRRHHEEVQ